MMEFKSIKLTKQALKYTSTFQKRVHKIIIEKNIMCRLGLCLSLEQDSVPDPGIYNTEESEFQISKHTLLGDYEKLLLALFEQWCFNNKIKEEEKYLYFKTHIYRGIEMLLNRVNTKVGIDGLLNLVKADG